MIYKLVALYFKKKEELNCSSLVFAQIGCE